MAQEQAVQIHKHAARHLIVRGATGQVRTATYQGTDHIVVPVTALMEEVIWPVNAEAAEFVPAEVLAQAPIAWNGRPVLKDHPEGGMVLAGTPEILEASSFGTIFNTIYDDKRLLMEAWLDPSRADAIQAKDFLTAIEQNKPIEVSVGALVASHKEKGVFNGKSYSSVWDFVIPDHLAFLSSGRGACSVNMGCGVRSAIHILTAKGLEFEGMTTERQTKITAMREAWGKFMALLGVGDGNLRRQLESALEGQIDNFLGIDMVYPDDHIVMYSAMDSETYGYKCYKASFTTDSSGKPTINTDGATEVIKQQTFVAAGERQPCGCGNNATTATSSQGAATMTKSERIAKLLSSGRFTETDKPWLEQVPEARLEALEAAPAQAAPAPTPAPTPAPAPASQTQPTAAAAAEPIEQTEETWLKTAPKAVREQFLEGKRVREEHRGRLIAKLGEAQKVFSAEQLAAKETSELEALIKLCGVEETTSAAADFSGLGGPSTMSAADADVYRNPPNGYKIALAKQNGEQKGTVQ